MEHVIIGTAGHVDHGKTELVKALTGHDTDRLQEEKARGMTIELGFAPFYIGEQLVSIVDVPGHEKLVKTMVSGASGMDMALLVVAANEGIMPQTVEHIHVISLLKIPCVMIVLTKVDLVDEDVVAEVTDQIRDFLEETPYPTASIYPVSSTNRLGIDTLIDQIAVQAKQLEAIHKDSLFRMPIDRVFTIKGHGTVITGTIAGGKITKDDTVTILPSHIQTKVRGLQVHGEIKDRAEAGQRCAINLQNIDKSLVARGQVLVKPDDVVQTKYIDVTLRALQGYTIKHNEKVRVHLGTSEVMGKVQLYNQSCVENGNLVYGRIRLEKNLVAVHGDYYILRSMTPIMTIGGGKILLPYSGLKCSKEQMEQLLYQLDREDYEKALYHILQVQGQVHTVATLYRMLMMSKQQIWKALDALVKERKVMKLGHEGYISQGILRNYMQHVHDHLFKYYQSYPYRIYMDKEALRSQCFPKLSLQFYEEIIKLMAKEKTLEIKGHLIAHKKIKRIHDIEKLDAVKNIERHIKMMGLKGLRVTTNNHEKQVKDMEEILCYLVASLKIREVTTYTYIHEDYYQNLIKQVKSYINQHKKISVIEARDRLGIGRKQTIILLEYLDTQGKTKRIDNDRIWVDKSKM